MFRCSVCFHLYYSSCGTWRLANWKLGRSTSLGQTRCQLHHATANGTFYVFVLASGNSAGTESADISGVCDPVV